MDMPNGTKSIDIQCQTLQVKHILQQEKYDIDSMIESDWILAAQIIKKLFLIKDVAQFMRIWNCI